MVGWVSPDRKEFQVRKPATPDQVMEGIDKQIVEHQPVMTGIPGVCVAAYIAPNCVVVREERIGFPFVYCLN